MKGANHHKQNKKGVHQYLCQGGNKVLIQALSSINQPESWSEVIMNWTVLCLVRESDGGIRPMK